MIVERIHHYPEATHYHDLKDLLKVETQRVSKSHLMAIRLYSDDIGCNASFAQDFEFEDYGERRKFWAEFFSSPGASAFAAKYNELVRRTMTRETWNLVE